MLRTILIAAPLLLTGIATATGQATGKRVKVNGMQMCENASRFRQNVAPALQARQQGRNTGNSISTNAPGLRTATRLRAKKRLQTFSMNV